jgi:drug/metabolite transporter (DMT)-like permease
MYKAQLHWQPIALLLIITMIWGSNMAAVKIASREMAPIFMAGFRSVVASLCLYIWMRARRIKVFPSAVVLGHGIVAGILFGSEFGLIFVGLEYTLASRGYVLLYVAPFFAAIGAHFFLDGDRLNTWKAAGLLSAFCGVVVLFMKNVGSLSFEALPGDILFIIAGASWGATTVYIKKYLVRHAEPLQILFYQLLFSAPFLLIISFTLEDAIIWSTSLTLGISLFYQCIIVAFLSYLVWFVLVSRYPVSLMHAFSFFTPVFGVLFSGILILGETISPNLVMALALVSIGMVLVNFQPKTSK